MATNYPYEMEVVKISENQPGLVRIGPKGYVFVEKFKDLAAGIYNMNVTKDDVFVTSFPRSGTTWTQELVWLVVNDLDYERAAKIPLTERYLFLEFSMYFDDAMINKLYEESKGDEKRLKEIDLLVKPAAELAATMPSPRFLKTHLPLSLLPPNALDAKVVHVARDPKDAIVSYYHLIESMKLAEFNVDFKTFWNLTIKSMQSGTPYFDLVKESWEKRNHPNLLFLFYEDMLKDLPSAVRRVCDFFGKKFSEEQIAGLCEHLKFENFKKNPSVNYDLMKEIGIMRSDKEFIRKGKTGGWRDYFDEEMTAQAQKWIEDNLKDTDLRFPTK